ncbi:MAG: 1-acyl-sn-glycerol-3-phosphate acyltransferase, partial [Oscillospiraceae bacterium]|nr:1-acyl-sn-glycerol-3-phosphate acyltransferase [Oscillospiraceae bacterium]
MKNYMFHRFMIKLTKIVAGPFLKNKMKYKCHISNDIDRPTLVLSNHTTNFDPLLVTLAFRKHMYFLASEHAFRAGFGSKVLRTVYSPIPFNKTKTDINAIKEVMHRLSAGANVCLFPEGDRSFSGTTVHSASSVVKLAKQCRVDVITFKLEGGYFTSPRWSTKMRKGKMSGAIVNKYLADEVAAMSEDELIGKINTDIYVDAYESQKENLVKYKGENLAENIEVSLYLCPSCKGIGYIKSKGDGFACRCGLSGRYTQAGYLEGPKLPFTKTTDWGKWQEETLG